MRMSIRASLLRCSLSRSYSSHNVARPSTNGRSDKRIVVPSHLSLFSFFPSPICLLPPFDDGCHSQMQQAQWRMSHSSRRPRCRDYLLVSQSPILRPQTLIHFSHIFCLRCADELGLTRAAAETRSCPACSQHLPNRDDAVTTVLQPTEDYKTSVLSGLDPTTIMECAGRALAFWSYQTAQEMYSTIFQPKRRADHLQCIPGALGQDHDKQIHSFESWNGQGHQ
jgi:hypothetical protein